MAGVYRRSAEWGRAEWGRANWGDARTADSSGGHPTPVHYGALVTGDGVGEGHVLAAGAFIDMSCVVGKPFTPSTAATVQLLYDAPAAY